MGFRYALCSEVFRTPIDETIRTVASLGFEGIELAPFNVAASVDEVSAGRRTEIRKVAESAGIEIVGLHWLLVSPEGLHITTDDDDVRERTARYLEALAHFCADVGGSFLVLGSPQQRNVPKGGSLGDARRRAAELLGIVGDTCGRCGVRLLVEALHPNETNFLQTIEEVLELNTSHGHPAVGYMLDCKAMSGMPAGVVGTTQAYGRHAGHFHANDPSGAGPGMGTLEFAPVLSALKDSGYSSGGTRRSAKELGAWVSSEPFVYEPDPQTVARTALQTLRAAEVSGG